MAPLAAAVLDYMRQEALTAGPDLDFAELRTVAAQLAAEPLGAQAAEPPGIERAEPLGGRPAEVPAAWSAARTLSRVPPAIPFETYRKTALPLRRHAERGWVRAR